MSPTLEELAKSYTLSTYRETIFEQVFCSELLQACWLAGLPPVELDRPFVDFQGYDLVATSGAVTRHAQLKSSPRGQISAHRAMAEKPSACIVNLIPGLPSGVPERLAFTYRYFGGEPGHPISLDSLKPAKKTVNTAQPDGSFAKSVRANHVSVPHGQFAGPMRIEDLIVYLFGAH